jgi:hypothetical protein
VITEYRVGVEGDQSAGLASVTVCAKSVVLPAVTDLAAEDAFPTSDPAELRIELATVTDASLAASFCTVTAMLTVALAVET